MNNSSRAMKKVDYTINGNIEKSNITGSCVGALTPSEFILALQDIYLYQPVDNADHKGEYWICSVMKNGSVSKFGTFTRIQNDMINNYFMKSN